MATELTPYENAFTYKYNGTNFVHYKLQILTLIAGQRLRSLNIRMCASLTQKERNGGNLTDRSEKRANAS